MGKRDLSPEEEKMWQRVARGIRPLSRGTHLLPLPDHMPDLDQLMAGDPGGGAKPLVTETERSKPSWTLPVPDALEPRDRKAYAEPFDRSGEKRVRRGQSEITASFDLHGFTQEKAPLALYQFVTSQRRQGARCVLVITGRGRAGGGVLRERFVEWLSLPDMRAHVSGYSQANRKHGGAGAWYVFLRARKS